MSWIQGIKGKVQRKIEEDKQRRAEEKRIYDEEYQRALAKHRAKQQHSRTEGIRERARAKATAPGLIERGISAAKTAAKAEMRGMARSRPPSSFDMWGFPTEQTRRAIRRAPKKIKKAKLKPRKKIPRRIVYQRQPRPESIYDYL